MGKMQRDKGAGGEREFAALVHDNLGVECSRRLNQSRDSGHDLDVLDYAIEVKRAKEKRFSMWWKQACESAELEGKIPVLAYRLDYQSWVVAISFKGLVDGFGDSQREVLDQVVEMPVLGFFAYVRNRY